MEKYIDENGNTRFRSNTPSVEKKPAVTGDYRQWAKDILADKTPKEQKQILKWWKSKNAKQTWGTAKAAAMREALKSVMGV